MKIATEQETDRERERGKRKVDGRAKYETEKTRENPKASGQKHKDSEVARQRVLTSKEEHFIAFEVSPLWKRRPTDDSFSFVA